VRTKRSFTRRLDKHGPLQGIAPHVHVARGGCEDGLQVYGTAAQSHGMLMATVGRIEHRIDHVWKPQL